MTLYQMILSFFSWPKHLCCNQTSHRFRKMLVKEKTKWGYYIYTAEVCVECGRINKSDSCGMC